MQFGVCVPNYGANASVETLREVSREVEKLGFDSIFLTDHILMPKNSGSPYEKIFESISTMAYLAATTRKVKLGISSLIMAMRNPVVVAKQLATIDALSSGRVILATSAGWNEREYGNLGSDFHTRGKRLDESIHLVRALWSSSDPAFESKRLLVSFKDVAFEPRPVQKRIPIWIAGNSLAAMKRAARLGDAWHPNVLPLDKFSELIRRFRSVQGAETKPICARIALSMTATTSTYTSPQGERRLVLTRDMEDNKSIVTELEKMGVSYMTVTTSPDGHASQNEQLEGLASFAHKFIEA